MVKREQNITRDKRNSTNEMKFMEKRENINKTHA